MRKIKKIEVAGKFNFTRITVYTYDTIVESFAERGIALPSYAELKRIGDRDRLWVLENDVVITITFEGGAWIQYKFEAGFIFDKASVPIFKGDILESLPGVMVHDANFSCKFLGEGNVGFRRTNKLFYRMNRQMGMNRWRAFWYYWGVNGVVGRSVFEKCDRVWWHGKTVKFMSSGGDVF